MSTSMGGGGGYPAGCSSSASSRDCKLYFVQRVED